MKCPHCKSEWTVRGTSADAVKSCPFCGKSLEVTTKKPEALKTFQERLCYIFQNQGQESFRDGKMLTSLHSDLFPGRKKTAVC